MVNRHSLTCNSCETKIVTRTQIGWGDQQVHAFPCPGCGVGITYVLNLDQKAVSFSYVDPPSNAKWAPDEEGAQHAVAFNAELVIPRDAVYLSIGVTPFIAAFGLFDDWEQFSGEEAARRQFNAEVPAILSRLRVHFERKNGGLFRSEAERIGERPDPSDRVAQLRVLQKAAALQRALFAVRMPGWVARVSQRFTYAETKARRSGYYKQVLREHLEKGRSLELWRQVNAFQARLAETSAFLTPALQPRRYWKKRPARLEEYVVCNKGFESLKALYIEAFETFARISTLAIALETVIATNSLEIPTKRGSMSIWDYDRIPNANKPDHLKKYPCEDMFASFMNTGLRNGIGHNSAHYDAASDRVEWTTHSAADPQRLHYTVFADCVQMMCSVLMHVQEYCYLLWLENEADVGL